MIDFEPTAEQQELKARVESFVRDKVIPFESDPRRTAHGPTDDLRDELVALAKAEGLLSPHVSEGWGGMGAGHMTKAVMFEASGYSMLGPITMNIAAPDEGNMHLLDEVATEAQKERYLKPLAAGEARSVFLMTEPSPGAGSDPGAMLTEARPDGNGWTISGRKWLITGAEGAKIGIVMARTFDEAGEDIGASMFMTPLPAEGLRVSRVLDTMDSSFTGGHAEVELDGLKVDGDAVLGEVGKGFRYAQVRLAPARLTHCMRWLGAAQRAHDIACGYARERESFGTKLIDHEGVGFMLADNEMDIHMSRLAVWHCAWVLDQGERGGRESSMAKVICSEALYRVADRCLQVLGGMGMTRDTEVERIFRELRGFRIYDGPSEVHRWSLAKQIKRR
ncbi:acyl-CoA dehydrogenase [Minwuia thermotolerans]|uniref:Acyl-CoA dehydrogenase n=1 Tax=Minwuia thermotolerans TaxID=2056226 RepID=A0A2M9G3Y7_9PROT|nr:acyl-CoA dehydrogenase family protein [Minwuia thermotolerans]PJK30404.1 acyl-CoA dehydrogenase [Minwuia thermotolerans]